MITNEYLDMAQEKTHTNSGGLDTPPYDCGILKVFAFINSNVSYRYCRDKYLEYYNVFKWAERQVIEDFELKYVNKDKKYGDKQLDIKVIDTFNDKEQEVILDFLDWLDTLPSGTKIIKCYYRPKYYIKSLFKTKVSKTKYLEERIKQRRRDSGSTSEKTELERCRSQQEYFSKKAERSKRKYYRIQILIMLLALCSSVVLFLKLGSTYSFLPDNMDLPKFISVLCSTLIVFCTGLDKLKQHVQEWTKNRIASERLKKEMNLYEQCAGDYYGLSPTEKKNLFVKNYEDIIAKDVDAFESNKSRIPADLEQIIKQLNKQDNSKRNDNVLKD